MGKLLTLNTHSWLETDQEMKLQRLVEHIIKEDYDIICLQEVNQSIAAEPAILDDLYCPLPEDQVIAKDNFAMLLAARLAAADHEYYWSWAYSHIGYDIYHEGVAILSKTPLLPRDFYVSEIVDERDYHTRKLLAGVTSLDGENVEVVSVHFSWWDKGFPLEWQNAINHLQGSRFPLIMMGDFNNPAGHEGHQLVLQGELALQDSYEAAGEKTGEVTIPAAIAGWEGAEEGLRIDYIFTDPALEIESYHTVFDGGKELPVSDHFGVSVVTARKN